MGNFNNLYSFISNRVLPKSSSDDIKENYNYRGQSYQYHQHSNSSALPSKEDIQQLFPCEDRHSFNPHYQHNLHSTSPSYSTPPSLSSSPTNSSPSSTTSSSSHSISQSSKYYSAHNQYSTKRSLSSQSVRLQQQQQQQQQLQQQQQQQPQQYQRHHRSYSYSRQNARRQNQIRNNANRHSLDGTDDDLIIGYDGQRIFYESGATSMARVHPHGSHSISSFPSSASSNYEQQLQSSKIYSAENENTPSPASRTQSAEIAAGSRSMHTSPENNGYIRYSSTSLPKISEATAVAYTREDDKVVAREDEEEEGVENQLGRKASKTLSNARITARYSLMRIVQCDIRTDEWCSQQSGQWTRHYAKVRSAGVKADGRRAGRY